MPRNATYSGHLEYHDHNCRATSVGADDPDELGIANAPSVSTNKLGTRLHTKAVCDRRASPTGWHSLLQSSKNRYCC